MNHLSMYLASALMALGLAGAAVPQIAEAQPSFRIARLYSSQDGVFQFIQLTEIAGNDNQSAFAGLTLNVTSHGRTKTFVFPSDLPSASTAHRSVVLASRELYDDLPFGDDMGSSPRTPTSNCQGISSIPMAAPSTSLAQIAGITQRFPSTALGRWNGIWGRWSINTAYLARRFAASSSTSCQAWRSLTNSSTQPSAVHQRIATGF